MMIHPFPQHRLSTVALVLAALSLPQMAKADPFAEALAAAQAGQYGAAAAGFHSLARQGDAEAAHNLALLFMTGQGVPRNHEEAAFWAWSARVAGVVQARSLVAQLMPGLDSAGRQRVADRIEAMLTPQAEAGDGAAMLALAAVMVHLRPKPDLMAAHAWQSIAAALDVPGAVAAREASLQGMDPARHRPAEAQALTAFQTWCGARRDSAPAACAIFQD